MFEKSGEKIKFYVPLYFVVNVITIIILGIIFLIGDNIIGAIFALVLGILSAYVGCLCMSVFGDLAEDSKENLNTNRQILKVLEELKETQKTPADTETLQEEPATDMIVCPKCKMVQRAGRTRCFNCGAVLESSEQSQ